MTNEIIGRILEARDIQDVWDVQCEAMESFGFDRLIYGYTNFAPGSSLGQIEDAVILTRHDRAYVDLFIGEGMYQKGPMIKWAAEHKGACSWNLVHRLIAEGKLTPDEMEMMAINMRMDVLAGYTMSFNDPSIRSKGALGLTAKRGLTQDDVDQIWAEKGMDIQLISQVTHLKITQLPHMNMRKPLTKRQAEVLQWVADGKTIRDVSQIMGLNPATIEKHLRLAREALGTDTTAQAILKASATNQFFLIDPSKVTED